MRWPQELASVRPKVELALTTTVSPLSTPQAEREPCLRALIAANANLEASDKDGSNALMMAAQDACRRAKGPSTPSVVPLPPWSTWRLRPP